MVFKVLQNFRPSASNFKLFVLCRKTGSAYYFMLNYSKLTMWYIFQAQDVIFTEPLSVTYALQLFSFHWVKTVILKKIKRYVSVVNKNLKPATTPCFQNKVLDQFLICAIGNIWRFWIRLNDTKLSLIDQGLI